MATDSVHSAVRARLIFQAACVRGIPAERCLRGTGLTSDKLLDPHAEIAMSQEFRLIDNVLYRIDDPALGVDIGRRYTAGSLGPVGMGIAASPTIREALKLVLRFQPIIFPGAEYTVEDAAGRTAISASLAIPKSPGAMHLLADVWSTAAVAILRPLCGVQSPFVEVSLPRPEPGTIRAWTSALGTTPVFGAPVASLTFDPALLDRPITTSDAQALSYCEQYCEELLGKQRRQHGSVALVRSQMFAYGGRVPSMEQLARDLRISDRTLHRILAAEDSSYRQLRDEVRLVLAQRLLNRPGLTIAQVATALGYDHPPSFTRAYRRWTGRNPSTGRET